MHDDAPTAEEEWPSRYLCRFTLIVPTSDYRNHPQTSMGNHHFIGNGIVHHDLINLPFYGRVYDTAIIGHPLSISDCSADHRTALGHVMYILSQLEEIQQQSRYDDRSDEVELRARRDSIQVLAAYRRKQYERFQQSCSPRTTITHVKIEAIPETGNEGLTCAEAVTPGEGQGS